MPYLGHRNNLQLPFSSALSTVYLMPIEMSSFHPTLYMHRDLIQQVSVFFITFHLLSFSYLGFQEQFCFIYENRPCYLCVYIYLTCSRLFCLHIFSTINRELIFILSVRFFFFFLVCAIGMSFNHCQAAYPLYYNIIMFMSKLRIMKLVSRNMDSPFLTSVHTLSSDRVIFNILSVHMHFLSPWTAIEEM